MSSSPDAGHGAGRADDATGSAAGGTSSAAENGGIARHLSELKCASTACRKHHLRLKLVKCYFFQIEVSWLGHQLGNDQIKPDPKLVSSILDYPVPQSLKTLRGFLGLALTRS